MADNDNGLFRFFRKSFHVVLQEWNRLGLAAAAEALGASSPDQKQFGRLPCQEDIDDGPHSAYGAVMSGRRQVRVGTKGRVRMPGLYVESPADPFVEAMEEADGEDLVILAVRAIRHDPGCIEARLVLADHSRDATVRMRHLETAVEVGEQLWGPVAAQMGRELTWWGFAGTRPYMRAIAALGQAYLDGGDLAKADACFSRLLAMNPSDNQGIRYLMQEPDCEAVAPGMR